MQAATLKRSFTKAVPSSHTLHRGKSPTGIKSLLPRALMGTGGSATQAAAAAAGNGARSTVAARTLLAAWRGGRGGKLLLPRSVEELQVLHADGEEAGRRGGSKEGAHEVGVGKQRLGDGPQEHRAKVEQHRLVGAVHDAVVGRCPGHVWPEVHIQPRAQV